MPIYADEVPFDDLRKLERNHVCAECGSFLRLSWSNERDCYILRCVIHEHHNGIRRLGRDPEIAEIKNKLKGEPLPMSTEQAKQETFSKMLARVDQARFPKDITTVERKLIAAVAIEYGLDPVFGELMIYQGRPYVTIDARRRKAQETEKLDGVNARPATRQERVARQVADGDYLFVAEVWVKGSTHPFEGWGTVRAAETKGNEFLPIVKDPAAQCEKRAEAQALRRAFHLPLPSFEEIVEGEFVEVLPGKEAPQSKSSPPKAQPRPTAPTLANRLTEPQRQKIWGDASKMGYSEDDIHKIIKAKWGLESVNDLTVPQASALIDMIQKGEGIPAPAQEKGEE